VVRDRHPELRRPRRAAHRRPDGASLALALAVLAAGHGDGLATAARRAPLSAAAAALPPRAHQLPALQWSPLVFFGVISYPLYLLHQRIGWTIVQHLGDQTVAARALGTAVRVRSAASRSPGCCTAGSRNPWRLRLRDWARLQ
jgi:peptidoglycan/LPS O-acetylase OafA/YrhL